MAQSSVGWDTNGVGDGTVTGYTEAQWAQMWRKTFCGDLATQGPLDVESGLEVTDGGTPDLDVLAGCAYVYGFWYNSTATEVLTLVTPLINTTGWRVVLRASWAAQTVRLVLLQSADGDPAIPAVTQVANTTWDISLAYGTILKAADGGIISITDDRHFVGGNLRWGADAYGRGNMADSYFNAATVLLKFVPGAITPASLNDRARQFWVPATALYNSTDGTALTGANFVANRGWELLDNKLVVAYGQFHVPSDFASGFVVTPIVMSVGAGNVYSYGYASYGQLGEASTTHSDTDAYAAVPLAGGLFIEIGRSVMSLANANYGDHVNLTFARNATNVADTMGATVYFMGWLAAYAADM